MDGWTTQAPLARTRTAEFMAAVYRWMSLGLGITGLVAWALAHSPGLLSAFYVVRYGEPVGVTGLYWVAIVAQLGLVFFFAPVAMRASLPAAVGMFLTYAATLGITLTTVLFRYTSGSIASTLFITGGSFFALSLYATTTKRNLSAMGTFLFVGLVGVVLGGVVNLFLQNSALNFVLTCMGVVVFAGLTAWDTQRIRAMGEEGDERHALLGALVLYLDFVNLFLFLLQLFGDRRRRD